MNSLKIIFFHPRTKHTISVLHIFFFLLSFFNFSCEQAPCVTHTSLYNHICFDFFQGGSHCYVWYISVMIYLFCLLFVTYGWSTALQLKWATRKFIYAVSTINSIFPISDRFWTYVTSFSKKEFNTYWDVWGTREERVDDDMHHYIIFTRNFGWNQWNNEQTLHQNMKKWAKIYQEEVS